MYYVKSNLGCTAAIGQKRFSIAAERPYIVYKCPDNEMIIIFVTNVILLDFIVIIFCIRIRTVYK